MASGVSFLLNPGMNIGTSAVAISAMPAAAAGGVAEGVLEAPMASYVAGGASVGGTGISASVGEAGLIGGLSVPQSWGTAAPAIRLASMSSPAAGLTGLPEATPAPPGGWFGGMPAVGSVVNAPRHGDPGPRYNIRRSATRPAAGDLDPPATSGSGCHFNGSERSELIGLRKAIAEVTKERDLLKRSAALLIKEALHKSDQ